jgi:hypothetical protein
MAGFTDVAAPISLRITLGIQNRVQNAMFKRRLLTQSRAHLSSRAVHRPKSPGSDPVFVRPPLFDELFYDGGREMRVARWIALFARIVPMALLAVRFLTAYRAA